MPSRDSTWPPVTGPYLRQSRWSALRLPGSFVMYNHITRQLDFAQFWVIHAVNRVAPPAVGLIADQIAGAPALSELAARGVIKVTAVRAKGAEVLQGYKWAIKPCPYGMAS